jgi:RNA polymerase sigma factor (sigma-70 family)
MIPEFITWLRTKIQDDGQSSNDELLKQWREGDENERNRAAEIIVRRHILSIWRACFVGCNSNKAGAEETTLATLAALAESFRSIKKSLPSWLRQVSYRICTKWRKRNKKELQHRQSQVWQKKQTINSPDDPILIIDNINNALRKLPNRWRTIVMMIFLEEMTIIEVAQELKVSEKTVSKIKTKALDRLRQIMDCPDGLPVLSLFTVSALSASALPPRDMISNAIRYTIQGQSEILRIPIWGNIVALAQAGMSGMKWVMGVAVAVAVAVTIIWAIMSGNLTNRPAPESKPDLAVVAQNVAPARLTYLLSGKVNINPAGLPVLILYAENLDPQKTNTMKLAETIAAGLSTLVRREQVIRFILERHSIQSIIANLTSAKPAALVQNGKTVVGLTITFSGIPSARGQTCTVNADGTFETVITVNSDATDKGFLYATVTDADGNSATEVVYIAPTRTK